MHADTTLRTFADFPEWAEVMTTWGDKMLAAVHTVAQMSAVGFGLPASAFTERMAHGPHLLAPTGDPLSRLIVGSGDLWLFSIPKSLS